MTLFASADTESAQKGIRFGFALAIGPGLGGRSCSPDQRFSASVRREGRWQLGPQPLNSRSTAPLTRSRLRFYKIMAIASLAII